MIYLGSKGRLSKELAPIIQSYITPQTRGYIEPFVGGGGNMIDKIKHDVKIGYDINKYVIACLKALSEGWEPPRYVNGGEYEDLKNNPQNYPDYLVGYVGFNLSFGGMFFSGYARNSTGKADYCKMGYNNVMKQASNLKGTEFYCKSFKELKDLEGYVIYCDPPYRGSAGYGVKFDYNYFYNWCMRMGKKNTVLISEYYMPPEFELVWAKNVKVLIYSNRTLGADRVEKLFRVI